MKHTIFAMIFAMIFVASPLFCQNLDREGRAGTERGERNERAEEAKEPKKDSAEQKDQKELMEQKNTPSSSEKKENESINYHGMRLPSSHEPFSVVAIVIGKSTVSIFFNVPINPRSFEKSDFFLNGKPLPKNASLKFNRSGKMLEITMPLPDEINLRLFCISSYDGEALSRTDFFGLRKDSSSKYKIQ